MLQLKLEIRPKARAAVSKVLLVGGATRMPAVKRFLTNMTGAHSLLPNMCQLYAVGVAASLFSQPQKGVACVWVASMTMARAAYTCVVVKGY